MGKTEELIENLDKNFNEDELKELSKAFGNMIKEGFFDSEMAAIRYRRLEMMNDEIEFSKRWGTTANLDFAKEHQNDKTHLEDSLIPFIKMCENHEIEFIKSRVFIELLRRTLLKNYLEIKEACFEKNIKEYMKRVNEKNLIINSRLAFQIINATRTKRYDFYEKIENVIKEITQDYDLSKYDEVISNKISLSKDEFYDFIKEVNNAKIKEGLIPYPVCEYLICEMLKGDSVISVEYDHWSYLRENVFCDLLSHLEMKECNEENYYNFVEDIEEKNGTYSCNWDERYIRLNENRIYNFKADYVLPLIGIFRFLEELKLEKELSNNNYSNENYLLLKDDLISNYMKEKKESSISIRKSRRFKNGAIKAVEFLEKLGVDISTLKTSKSISLAEHRDEYSRKYNKDSAIYNFVQNVNSNLEKTLQEMADMDRKMIFRDTPILKYEYNEDGTRKSITEILESIEEAYSSKTESEENIEGLLKYSVLCISYWGEDAKYINNIINYQYHNEQFKKLCFKICQENIEEGEILTIFLEDDSKKEEIHENFVQQFEVIIHFRRLLNTLE